jgi:uncharacterized protein (TIGR02996 family)
MLNDNVFLAKLLEVPGDDTTRLVYADWLDEQGDSISAAKAEFLRVTVQLASPMGRKGWRKERQKRLQQLAAKLDTDWLAVVSRLPIENCHGKRTEEESRLRWRPLLRFDYLCDRRWEDLKSTDDKAVRFCDACRQSVHYCDTITEARRHAGDGHCIAVDLGVIRRDGDLRPTVMALGWPSPEEIQREAERMQPDPVSAERERRKREREQGERSSS